MLYTPSPGGWGIFFWNTPGDPGAGDFKTQNTPGPPGWGIFLRPGVWHLYLLRKRKRHHQQWSNFLHQWWWWWWWQRRRRCDGVIWDLSCFRQNRSTCQQDPRYVYLYRTTYDRVLSSRLQIWGNLIRNYFGWTLSDICLQFSQDIFKVNCFFVFFI